MFWKYCCYIYWLTIWFDISTSEAYSDSNQTSKMELFAKIVIFTTGIFRKRLILNDWLNCECASEQVENFHWNDFFNLIVCLPFQHSNVSSRQLIVHYYPLLTKVSDIPSFTRSSGSTDACVIIALKNNNSFSLPLTH